MSLPAGGKTLSKDKESERTDVMYVDEDYVLASDEEWATDSADDNGDDAADAADEEGSRTSLGRNSSAKEYNAGAGMSERAAYSAGGARSAAFMTPGVDAKVSRTNYTTTSSPVARSDTGDNDAGADAGAARVASDAIASKEPTAPATAATSGIRARLAEEVRAAISLLSHEEKQSALDAFRHCDVFEEGRISEQGLYNALSLLGTNEPEEKIRALYLRRKQDLLDEVSFLALLGELRASTVDKEQLEAISVAFQDLYHATLSAKSKGGQWGLGAEQRDEMGRPYLLVADLRKVLTTCGEVLSDQEVDQLLRDCKPVYGAASASTGTARGGGGGAAGAKAGSVNSGEGDGKIFYENYRAMLLGLG
jgi:Ca2+-binding EF-hand superfamily protein